MKPLIGIISRPLLSDEKHVMFGIYEDISLAIIKNGGIPIGILPEMDNISFCDGLVFQGGNNFTDYEKEYMKYAYENNIPTLGICLGMQLMGVLFGGKEYEVVKHKNLYNTYVHDVIIDKSSKLYKILDKERIKVNSRHKSAIKNIDFDIAAKSEDGVIEALEDRNKKFFIGIQWHPESMIDYDINSNKIFKEFIKIAKT